MQTFLPYPDFQSSARVLDWRRLGKQRVETLQLLRGGGWRHHPAAQMWRGHSNALVAYGLAICDEWLSRGYADTCRGKILEHYDAQSSSAMPHWLGDPAFHAAHRSNLLRKDPIHYGQFGWTEPADLPYLWPTNPK